MRGRSSCALEHGREHPLTAGETEPSPDSVLLSPCQCGVETVGTNGAPLADLHCSLAVCPGLREEQVSVPSPAGRLVLPTGSDRSDDHLSSPPSMPGRG